MVRQLSFSKLLLLFRPYCHVPTCSTLLSKVQASTLPIQVGMAYVLAGAGYHVLGFVCCWT